MKEHQVTNTREVTIDIKHVLHSLLYKIWIIVLVGVISGTAGYLYTSRMVTPKYSAHIDLYVNNNNETDSSGKLTTSDINAAKGLIKMYEVILKNHVTFNDVIEKGDFKYTASQLNSMVSVSALNDTAAMRVTVTHTDAQEAADIANCIAEVLPARISEIIDGSSTKVVAPALPNTSKVSPNVTRSTVTYAMIGMLISAAVISIFAVMDDTIHDVDYTLRNCEFPILARIPNLSNNDRQPYGKKHKSISNKKGGKE